MNQDNPNNKFRSQQEIIEDSTNKILESNKEILDKMDQLTNNHSQASNNINFNNIRGTKLNKINQELDNQAALNNQMINERKKLSRFLSIADKTYVYKGGKDLLKKNKLIHLIISLIAIALGLASVICGSVVMGVVDISFASLPSAALVVYLIILLVYGQILKPELTEYQLFNRKPVEKEYGVVPFYYFPIGSSSMRLFHTLAQFILPFLLFVEMFIFYSTPEFIASAILTTLEFPFVVASFIILRFSLYNKYTVVLFSKKISNTELELVYDKEIYPIKGMLEEKDYEIVINYLKGRNKK